MWYGYYKYYNNFDAEDLRTSTNIDWFDGVSYVGNSRVEYSYNDDGLVDTVLFLDYTGGDYDPYYRHILTYSAGQLANIVYQDYGADWENDFLEIYTYTGGGVIDNVVYQNWDGDSWYDEGRYLYSYDPEGNLIERLAQSYDAGWETDGRYYYSYDAEDFNYLVEVQIYDGVDYLNNQKFDLTEFEDGLPEMNTISYWDGFIWEASNRVTYGYETYDDGTVSIEDVGVAAQFNLYPNPVSDEMTVEFLSASQQQVSILITDISGKTISRQTIVAMPGINRINKQLENALPGIYQLKLTVDGTVLLKSFVVE
jgi:hypothetical protein